MEKKSMLFIPLTSWIVMVQSSERMQITLEDLAVNLLMLRPGTDIHACVEVIYKTLDPANLRALSGTLLQWQSFHRVHCPFSNEFLKKTSSIWIDEADHSYVTIKEPSNPELQDNIVYAYFEKKKIKKLFNFMVQHLIINEPDNPIEYLKDLADKLLMWRSGTVSKAPQLFEERHVEAIYKAMDPADIGAISLEQYHNGFSTLMVENYELYPSTLHEENAVAKKTFMKNALAALDKNLMSLIVPPYSKLCELTILPDESYDFLFQDESSKDLVTFDDDATKFMTVQDASKESCASGVSCVELVQIEDDRESRTSEASFLSEEVSVLDLEGYDFLVRKSIDTEDNSQYHTYARRVTIPGSKVTILGGKFGDNAKNLLAEEMTLNSFTTQSKKSTIN